MEVVLRHGCVYDMGVYIPRKSACTTSARGDIQPGGNHGAVCVNFIENIVGPPGLTALLFFVAIALLTFISKQTITWVRRMFNPLKSITGKASEIVTDKLNNNDSETTSVENGYTASVATSSNTANAKKDTAKSAEPTPVIDLTEFSNLGQKKTSKGAGYARLQRLHLT